MSIIKLASDTLISTPATGNIEYNGQFFATDSNSSRAQMQRFVQETAKTASGTSVDFTGIPSWVKRITVMLNGISASGTSIFRVQVGSGSVLTSGYLGSVATSTSNNPLSAGFDLSASAPAAASAYISQLILTNVSGNNWVCSWTFGATNGALGSFGAGSIALSGTLDRVRITTVNGTDTFDAGTINILYEG